MKAEEGEDSLYYQIGERIVPLPEGEAPSWEKMAAVLTPEELANAALPQDVFSRENMPDFSKCRSCKLVVEQDRIWGGLHIPAGRHRRSGRVVFQWWKDRIIFVDSDGIADACMRRVIEMRPHHVDGADDLMMDFFLALIMEDLTEIQELEDQITELEQDVLVNRTEKFIGRMSQLRKELNALNRYYAQMNNLVVTLQENAADWLDSGSQNRLQYVLRRLDHLQNETQMLREYASQVSSEYQAQVDIAQNRIMKLLTVVTSIFMPLSLIAGWYGMNFSGMPELHWAFGYPAVILLSILVVIGCTLYFKRKHYW